MNRSKLVGFQAITCFGAPAASVATTELSRRPRVLAPDRSRSPTSAGQAMTTFNRIFTTERLLQIIVILAATIAMKLMA
ncbi:hypothetical protein BJS_05867 [Bradyrhizobium japonicum SEMIA 5079]|nr:hypothetical protein BJS_05867 [Bradyrhizobium japonicum SEMIA 5079]